MPPRPLAALNSLVLLAAMLTLSVSPSWSQEPPSAAAARDASVVAVPDTHAAPVDPALPVDGAEPAAEEPVVEEPVAEEPPAPEAVPAPSADPAPAPAPPPAPRVVYSTSYQPYASVGPVVLHTPGDVVEVIGYHQSGHDGAQPQQPVAGTPHLLLESRGRDTHPTGAADIVVDPTREVRSPVTGTVRRAGTYTLYCDHSDQYVVIEPEARPGWEVKVLHFEGLSVRPGDRVEGGVTVIGSGGRVLPFASQVDKHTAEPSWPHLHVEVVDPTVPNRPKGPGCR
jgi:hypothetical protein